MAVASRTYTGVAIVLHWLIAVMLISTVFYGWWMNDLRAAAFNGEASISSVQTAFNWHKTSGIAILILSLIRLAWRFTHPVPAIPAGTPGWQAFAARFTHVAFYVAMIGIPIGGYVAASSYSAGFPILLFDQIEMPKLPVPRTEEFQALSGSLHGRGGWVILSLLALHAGAALKHHVLDRDGVLQRMIPGLDIPKQSHK